MKGRVEMGFWIFMAICCMLVPFTMILAGYVFVRRPPKKINNLYGYRTSMSRKNQDTWDFAHYYCGKLWWKTGWGMCFITLLVMFPTIGKGDGAIGWAAGIWIQIQCAVLIMSIAVVERALKRRFDKNGNARL